MRIKMDVVIDIGQVEEAMRQRKIEITKANLQRFVRLMKGNELSLSQEFYEGLPTEERVLEAFGFSSRKVASQVVKKQSFAQAVRMTKEEYSKLLEQFGEGKTKWCIEKLNGYKISKGRAYASDYMTILGWVKDAYEEEKRKGRIRPQRMDGYHDSLSEEELERKLVEKRETVNKQMEGRGRYC